MGIPGRGSPTIRRVGDLRFGPMLAADERHLLEGMLDFHREVVTRKTGGLNDQQLHGSPVRTGTNLIGLVHHLKRSEEWWFEGCFAGLAFEGDPRHEHQAPHGATVEEVVESYRRQCARSREVTQGAGLDDVAKNAFIKPTLRWILIHMIEETARHNGHADILRELLDGATGE